MYDGTGAKKNISLPLIYNTTTTTITIIQLPPHLVFVTSGRKMIISPSYM
jgi:hypothetical protein